MNVSEKLVVLMEFTGYTKDELEAYLSLKFGSMTKGDMTASILNQPQLNENQQIVLEWLKESYRQGWGATTIRAIYLLHKENAIEKHESSYIRKAYRKLNTFEEAIVVKLFAEWALEQEEE